MNEISIIGLNGVNAKKVARQMMRTARWPSRTLVVLKGQK